MAGNRETSVAPAGLTDYGGRSLALGRSRRRRHDAELLHQPCDVPLSPVLDALAFVESGDVDAGDFHLFSRGRDPHELRGVRARHRAADDDFVALGDDVVDRRATVGNAARSIANHCFSPSRPGAMPGGAVWST